MKANVKPLFDNVLIKPLEAETKTASGIVLPDSAAEKPQMGEVIAVGPGVMDDGEIVKNSMQIKIGQRVFYKKWGGDEIKLGSENFMLVKQTDILGVIE